MSEFPLGYDKIAPITWAYLSSLLMMGLFFKFSRFWSVRNLDLVLLMLLAPGLLMVHFGSERRQFAQAELNSTQATSNSADADSIDAESLGNETSAQGVEAVKPGGERDGSSIDVETAQPKSIAQNKDGIEGPLGTSSIGASGAGSKLNEQQAASSSHVDSEKTAGDAVVTSPQLTRAIGLERSGYIWLFSVSALFLIRMLIDPMMVRRPLLEPNLTGGGLTFIGCAMMVFLFANVVTSQPTEDDLYGPVSAENLVERRVDQSAGELRSKHGPGYALLHILPSIPTFVDKDQKQSAADVSSKHVTIAKTMAIISQLALAIGIVVIGYRHFGNYQMGVGIATLYLMLPYTAQMTGHVNHILPAALLVWALVCYRRPLASGIFLGLAMGVCYYPLFLLPLWMSFYWRRGLGRFSIGFASMVVVLGISLAFVSADFQHYVDNLRSMFGIWLPKVEGLQGVWALGWDAIYRLPILAGFIVISFSFAFWPAQKNLGTLLSCSCAIMVAVQFWHGFGGGLYMAWYLPLALLTFFRPNLEDRVALSVLSESWLPKRLGHAKRNAA